MVNTRSDWLKHEPSCFFITFHSVDRQIAEKKWMEDLKVIALVKYDLVTVKHKISDKSSVYKKGHLSYLIEAERNWKADVGLRLASSSWNYNRTHFSFPFKLCVAMHQETSSEMHHWLGFGSHGTYQTGQVLGQVPEAAAVKGTIKEHKWIGRLISLGLWKQLSWSLATAEHLVLFTSDPQVLNEFYILEPEGAVKSVKFGKLVEIPPQWHLLVDFLSAQISCQASNTLQLAGVESNKSSILLVITWCFVKDVAG